MTIARAILLPLVLLCLFGCVKRSAVSQDHGDSHESGNPIVQEHRAQDEVAGEASAARKVCLAGILLSLTALFILRGLIPGFSWIAGACAAAFACVYGLALVVTFLTPWLPWIVIGVVILGGAATAWHFRRWILSP